ncbi:MAG: PadR family transcriptional regulator [Thermoanaerobaculia bacterium]
MKIPSSLELQLLAVLEDGPRHGYSLREELRRRSAGVFDPLPGTLYPLLRRLEIGGLVDSAWQAGPRRRRRVYRLTAAGGRELDLRLREWVEFVGAVTAVIGGGE